MKPGTCFFAIFVVMFGAMTIAHFVLTASEPACPDCEEAWKLVQELRATLAAHGLLEL